ncbi:phasin family protein [Kribbella lupini]|uniref:Poly(Hydroxyalkanoate) granule associated protein phasin n=1 Tax=Kribbella lupini TaxID=291602 RepID=A0ABN2C6L6_9ACTN
MVMDALRGYVQLANGLTEVTRQRAQQAAKALLQQTGADALTTKVTDLADEIVATSKSNRQLLQAIVANEVEGAVSRLGFVRQEEVGVLSRRVDKLEKELVEARAAADEARVAGSAAATAAGTAAAAAEKAVPLQKPPVRKSAAKKPAAVAKKAAAPAKKTAKKAPAKKA